jgi:hypothetical protein
MRTAACNRPAIIGCRNRPDATGGCNRPAIIGCRNRPDATGGCNRLATSGRLQSAGYNQDE